MNSPNRRTPRSAWRGLWRLIPKRSGAAVTVLYLGAAALDGVSVGLVLPFLSIINGGDADPSSHHILTFATEMLAHIGIPFTLGPVLALVGAAALLRSAMQLGASALLARLVERVLVRTRVKLVDNLLRVAPRYHGSVLAGELAQAVLDDVEKTGLAIAQVFKLVSGASMVIAWTALMLVFSWRLTLLSAVVAAVLTVVVRMRIAYSARLGHRIADTKRKLSSIIVEVLAGLRLIWISTTELSEVDRVRSESVRLAAATEQLAVNSAIVNAVGENFGTFALLGIVYISVVQFKTGMTTLVAFFFVLTRVLPMSHRLNVLRNEMAGYAAHALNVFDMLSHDDKPYIVDGTREFSGLRSDVTMTDVWFEHRPGEPVLKGVSLSIRRGDTVAIAGSSGAGKSTIVDLLARFADPAVGEIRVDGVPLHEYRVAEWRRHLGIVSQDVFLFHDTIRNNIGYGAGAIDEARIQQAARLANAHEFIVELPHGYDTVVGERGLSLSGGQRQRISLARALARHPDLLILDEATSALDAESERAIFDAIERLAGRMTIVVVGHRLASLSHADRIYVIESGEIVESGTHDQLIASNGRYARFCRLQRV